MTQTDTGARIPSIPSESTVRLAIEGDAAAREELARSCQRAAFLFALQLVGQRDDALDLAQEAVLRLFVSLRRLDSSRPVRPYLLRIVRNLVCDRARRSRVRPVQPLATSEDGLLLEPADPDLDPEARAARREIQRLVWTVVQGLSAEHREVIALRDYLDLSYDEIATTLKIARGTVMSRLHRARQQLRRRVKSRLEGGAEVSHA
ncbi:MAG: RNA polymerase sigma factor [Acidobacteriota bacterium]|nr:MAG: RNA polymerase sigma factor [Acidobacteriota bacterium]